MVLVSGAGPGLVEQGDRRVPIIRTSPDQKTSAGDQGGFIHHRCGGKISQCRSDGLVESDLIVGRSRWNIPAAQIVECRTHRTCNEQSLGCLDAG
jgi:hypothetical protein